MTGLLRALMAALLLCAALVAPASAQQSRNDLFTISGVRVDETAANAQAARAAGLAKAQATALDRLARRLSTAEEYARLGPPRLPPEALDRLVAGIDVQQERATGTRYIAQLGFIFNPAMTRAALRQLGYAVLETRGPTLMVVPQVTGAAPAAQDAFRQVWTDGGYGQELVPLAVAPPEVVGVPDWGVAGPAAGQLGAASALFVTARVAGGAVTANLEEIGPDGVVLRRGQVSASLASGAQGLAGALQQIADAANAQVQGEWKTRLASGAAARTRVSAQAVYRSAAEWRRLKQALAASTRSLVSDVRIEAVGKEAAALSFSYIGAQPQLAAELGRGGVLVEGAGEALILRMRGG